MQSIHEDKKFSTPIWKDIDRIRAIKRATGVKTEEEINEIIKLADEIIKHIHYPYIAAKF